MNSPLFLHPARLRSASRPSFLPRLGRLSLLLALGALSGSACRAEEPPRATRLYWFIPDGLRADPQLFTLYRWAEEGRLPAIARLLREGAHGYSQPVFPSNTPVNFATLLTGCRPACHGIADGPMHAEGAPLALPSVKGFAATAKRVDPIWRTLEAAGKRVALLSIPGSTPPEIERGLVVRGRWGDWGADTPAVIFEPLELLPQRAAAGAAFKLFFLGQRLTQFVPTSVDRASGERRAELAAYGAVIRAAALRPGHPTAAAPRGGRPLAPTAAAGMTDRSAGPAAPFAAMRFVLPDGTSLHLRPGERSDWLPITLTWKDQAFQSAVRITLIKLWPASGFFRVRLFFDNANPFNTQPSTLAAQLREAVGPMVDFVDNWPAQLAYEPEDQAAFKAEAADTLAWHRRAAAYLLRHERPDVLIQDTYTPNQMLESRWWLPRVEPPSAAASPERADALSDLLAMYQGVDAILGEALDAAPADTLIVLSSDHGIHPLWRQVRLNNLFAQRGWLRYTLDADGLPAIDWAATRVVFLKMANVYVHPDGLGGPWRRGSGPAYEALRAEVAAAIAGLRDPDPPAAAHGSGAGAAAGLASGQRQAGVAPLIRAVPWEQVEAVLQLPPDRSGDLVLEVRPGYQWYEELTPDGALFARPRDGGYKQALDPTTPAMWTPFVIKGPGVRPGAVLARPISHVDQLPTILHLLGVPIPAHVEGRVLTELLTP